MHMRFLFLFLLGPLSTWCQAWYRLPDFPGSKRDDGVAVTVNQTLYAGTGLQEGWSATIDFYAFDLLSMQWKPIPTMPHTTERQYGCAFAGPNCFYVFGGDGVGGPLNNLYKYDIATATWSLMASKPGNGLLAASCLAFGDTVVIAGGKVAGPGPLNQEVWQYILSKNTWEKKADLPFAPRWRASSAVLNQKGYLMFGIDSLNAFRKDIYRYDLTNDSWQKIADFPGSHGRAYSGMVSTGKRLVVFGGVDSLANLYNDVWYYNDANNMWIKEANLPASPRKGGMMGAIGNRVVYTCGVDGSGRLNESWITDIPLGISEERQTNTLVVYPNPCQDRITLSNTFQEDVFQMRLCNMMSQEVMPLQMYRSDDTIDIRFLPNGIYLLEWINRNNQKGVLKLIKN
jgi:N-acetylneuraminic acid mutarotase